MTERDYLAVTALQQLRVARELFCDVYIESVLDDQKPRITKIIKNMNVLLSQLEEIVADAMEEGDDEE